MYMNNKAVEALAKGEPMTHTHGRARRSCRVRSISARTTLWVSSTCAVATWRRLTKVFSYLLEREPANARAMSNLAQVFARQGRDAESGVLLRRLAQDRTDRPVSLLQPRSGGDGTAEFPASARELFAKEVARADYQSEFHFWLAVANFKLGDIEPAQKSIESGDGQWRDRARTASLYAAKLAWLQTHREQ